MPQGETKSNIQIAGELFGTDWIAKQREIHGDAADAEIARQLKQFQDRRAGRSKPLAAHESLSPVTGYGVYSYDEETSTHFDKVSIAMLNTSRHNFSAEYEAGYRARHAGQPVAANPYRSKKARDRWERGWLKRNRYGDDHWLVEPITDNNAVIYVLAILFFIVLPIILGLNGISH